MTNSAAKRRPESAVPSSVLRAVMTPDVMTGPEIGVETPVLWINLGGRPFGLALSDRHIQFGRRLCEPRNHINAAWLALRSLVEPTEPIEPYALRLLYHAFRALDAAAGPIFESSARRDQDREVVRALSAASKRIRVHPLLHDVTWLHRTSQGHGRLVPLTSRVAEEQTAIQHELVLTGAERVWSLLDRLSEAIQAHLVDSIAARRPRAKTAKMTLFRELMFTYLLDTYGPQGRKHVQTIGHGFTVAAFPYQAPSDLTVEASDTALRKLIKRRTHS